MTLAIGSLDRLKIVSDAIESVRTEAKNALESRDMVVYSNRMLDLAALEMVLANETKAYIKKVG